MAASVAAAWDKAPQPAESPASIMVGAFVAAS